MIRFGSLIWGGATLAILIGCYSVSLKAGSERKAVEDLRVKIASDMRTIRNIESEFRTRARMSELQRYNDDVFALSAVSMRQIIRDPVQLAAFEVKPEQPPVRYAVAEAPAPAPAPVRTVAYEATPALESVGALVAAADPRADVRQISLQVAR